MFSNVIRILTISTVLGIGTLRAAVALSADDAVSPTGSADVGESSLRAALQNAVMQGTLQGAFADVRKTADGALEVAATVDSDPVRQKLQIVEIQVIAGRLAGKAKVSVSKVAELPFSKLISAMQASVKADPQLVGVQIEGGFYELGGNDSLFVQWIGRITARPEGDNISEMLQRVQNVGNKVLDSQYGKLSARVQATKAEVAKPDSGRPGILVNHLDLANQPPVDTATEGRLRRELREAASQQSGLHGSWAEVLRSPSGSLQIEVIADKRDDRAKSQMQLITQIADRVAGAGRCKVEVVEKLPFSDMLESFRQIVEVSPKLTGVRIDGACYHADDSGELFVYPTGLVTNAGRLPLLNETLNEVLKQHFGSTSKRVRLAKVQAEEVDAKRPGLYVRAPSTEAAYRFFNEGINHYVRLEYKDAYQWFTKATAEFPDNHEWQYWRVASLIGMCDEQRAKSLLRELLRSHTKPRSSGAEADVAVGLERVVGRIRRRLWELENSML